MKKLIIPCFALAIFMMACNGSGSDNGSDSSSTSADYQTSDTASVINTDTGSSDHGMNMNADSSGDFITEAGAGGMMEVQLGELSKTHAASQAVKDFGAMMVRDHTKANTELKAIADKNGITIPAALPNKFQKHIDDLSAKNGAEFDKDYISMMVDDHEEDIKLFERCAKSDDEKAEVKTFAAKTLPVLYKHRDAAKKLKDSMDK